MDIKSILFLIAITALLIGGAYAGSSDFKVDDNYTNTHKGEYYSLYTNGSQDSGIVIYKNVDDDSRDELNDADAYGDIIREDGRDYLSPDDDFKIDAKSDNIAEFTDLDHAEHGVTEIVKKDNAEYIVVFWAKDTSSVSNSDLSGLLKDFNRENNLEAIAF